MPDAVERDLAQAKGYHCLFSHCTVPRKASYSGVATFIRSDSGLKTLASTKSLADNDFFGFYDHAGSFSAGLSPDRLGALDSEGRVLVTDHGHFVLFNVYAPCTRCAALFGRSYLFALPVRTVLPWLVLAFLLNLLPCEKMVASLVLNIVWSHVSTGNRSCVLVVPTEQNVSRTRQKHFTTVWFFLDQEPYCILLSIASISRLDILYRG